MCHMTHDFLNARCLALFIKKFRQRKNKHKNTDVDPLQEAADVLLKNKASSWKDALNAIKVLKYYIIKGNVDAKYYLGVCYYEGIGMPQSRTRGEELILSSAQQGNVEAMVYLASIYYAGEPITDDGWFARVLKLDSVNAKQPNYEEALFWAEKAATFGNVKAYAILGNLCNHGPDEFRDREKAIAYYRKTEGKDALSAYFLAMLLLEKDDIQEYIKYLKIASSGNVVQSFYPLAYMYENGIWVKKDRSESFQLYEKSAKLGDVRSQFRLGCLFLDEKKILHAETWLRKAISQGHAESAFVLGKYLFENEDRKLFGNEAIKFLKKSMELGSINALQLLSKISYEKGNIKDSIIYLINGVKKNNKSCSVLLGNILSSEGIQDVDWIFGIDQLKKLAETGNKLALWQIGVCLRVSKRANFTESLRILLSLEDSDIIEAKVMAAEMILNGHGCHPQPEKAFELFLQAANLGHVGSMYAVGTMLKNGVGTNQDLEQSQFWLSKHQNSLKTNK